MRRWPLQNGRRVFCWRPHEAADCFVWPLGRLRRCQAIKQGGTEKGETRAKDGRQERRSSWSLLSSFSSVFFFLSFSILLSLLFAPSFFHTPCTFHVPGTLFYFPFSPCEPSCSSRLRRYLSKFQRGTGQEGGWGTDPTRPQTPDSRFRWSGRARAGAWRRDRSIDRRR